MKLITTLEILRKHGPCSEGWKKLIKHLGTDFPATGHIEFSTILESNGLDNALWGLRAVLPEQEKYRDKAARLFAADCAEAVLPLFEAQHPNDKRPREAIQSARDFSNGKITAAAWDAAWAAAWDAAGAAQKKLFLQHFCS